MKILNLQFSRQKQMLFYGLLGITVLPSCFPDELDYAVTNQEKIFVENRNLVSYDDIMAINDSLVKPVLYNELISLADLPLNKKKQKFVDMILPSVLLAKHNMDKKRQKAQIIESLITEGHGLADADSLWLNEVLSEYKADNISELIIKLKTHPVSIVIAQAALESGWGTSRFFLEGKNIFGVWSFSKNDQRMKARHGRDGKNIYVKKYDNLSDSIEDYFKVIARSGAYKSFRQNRMSTDDPYQLIPYLHRYSELGEVYIKRLASVIRKNDMPRYDTYTLDPQFILDAKDNQMLVASLN